MSSHNCNDVDSSGDDKYSDDDLYHNKMSVIIASDAVAVTSSSIPHAYGVLSVLCSHLFVAPILRPKTLLGRVTCTGNEQPGLRGDAVAGCREHGSGTSGSMEGGTFLVT
jgi:hypothetical protein